MRTYNEKQQELLTSLKDTLKIQQENLEKARRENDIYAQGVYSEGIKKVEKNIENIDEATKAYIGYQTNNFLKEMSRIFDLHSSDYFDRYDIFLDQYVTGDKVDSNGERNNIGMELGVTKEDLECFRGKNPNSDEAMDSFKVHVNKQFGTNIPSNKEMEMMKVYENSENREDCVRYAELRRDSGQATRMGCVIEEFVADTIANFDRQKKQQTATNSSNKI